jgi:hypothetical protein
MGKAKDGVEPGGRCLIKHQVIIDCMHELMMGLGLLLGI